MNFSSLKNTTQKFSLPYDGGGGGGRWWAREDFTLRKLFIPYPLDSLDARILERQFYHKISSFMDFFISLSLRRENISRSRPISTQTKKKERFSAKCFDDFNPRGFYLPGTFRLVIQDQSSTTDSLAKYLATIILSKERAAKNYRVRFTDSMRLFKNNSFQTRCVPHGVYNSTDCENKNIVRVSYADSTQKLFPRRGLFATKRIDR